MDTAAVQRALVALGYSLVVDGMMRPKMCVQWEARIEAEQKPSEASDEVSVKVVRGALTRQHADGSSSVSQNICVCVDNPKPSPGITGLAWNQPPDGVAANCCRSGR